MKTISSLKVQQLCYLSRPKCNRMVYRLIKQHRIRNIVEYNLGDMTRTRNMLQFAQKFAGDRTIRFAGIDLFDARPAAMPPLELIRAHQELARLGIKAQLVPGTLGQTIPRIANSHLRTDLVVISAGYQKDELKRCWTFLPRMLCATSLVLLQPENDPEAAFQQLTRMEIERIVRKLRSNSKVKAESVAA